MLPFGQLIQTGSVNPTAEEQKRLEELQAIQAMLAQARSPQAAAQRRMDASDSRNEARRAAIAALAEKYGQPIDVPALMRKKRSGEYTALYDPGITRGRPKRLDVAPETEDPALLDKRAQLVVAMNARAAAKLAATGKTASQIENDRMADPKYQEQRAVRKDLAEQMASRSRNKNMRLAYARGTLRPGAVSVGIQEEILPDERLKAAQRQALIASAANEGRNEPLQEGLARQLNSNPRAFWMGYTGNDIGSLGGSQQTQPGAFNQQQANGGAQIIDVGDGRKAILYPDGRLAPLPVNQGVGGVTQQPQEILPRGRMIGGY